MAEKPPDPRRMARQGYGWNDLVVRCGLTEAHARLIVFGLDAYARWKAKQEKRAS